MRQHYGLLLWVASPVRHWDYLRARGLAIGDGPTLKAVGEN